MTSSVEGGGSMFLKIYSLMILILDVFSLLVKVVLAILEGIYYAVVGVKEKSVAGEIVLITGTGHGIGKELAQQYAALGSIVVCWDINQELNEETVQELRKMGAKAYAYKCDVSDREAVLQLAKKVKAEVGDISILVNNAGIMPCHPLLQHNQQEIRRIFDINVLAHFWMLEAFLPAMIQNNHGHVVALSSMAGVMGIPNLVPYCGSKYAVRGLMEALSEELREDARHIDVKFTSIFPFIVDTGLCKNPRSRHHNCYKSCISTWLTNCGNSVAIRQWLWAWQSLNVNSGRFPFLLNYVSPKAAASAIISAQRKNYNEVSIPGSLLHLNNFMRMAPLKARQIFKDFMDSGVDPD